MDQIHKIYFIEREITRWVFAVWASRPDKLWPEMWKHMSDASKREEEQIRAIEKPKLDNAEDYVVCTLLILRMRNSRVL